MLAYVSGYSEPMGHIKGDDLLDGIHAFRFANGVLAQVHHTRSRCLRTAAQGTAILSDPSVSVSDWHTRRTSGRAAQPRWTP